MAADAAEAAEEAPRALMIAAPRCCTSGINSSLSQDSFDQLRRGLAFDRRMMNIRGLRCRVVTPDRHATNIGNVAVGLACLVAPSLDCDRDASSP